jgi:dTDP-4-amino-4,6-dideoxygalactose transaminase
MRPYAAYADGPLPVVEAASSQVLSLPLYPSLPLEDVERVASLVNQAAAGSLVA